MKAKLPKSKPCKICKERFAPTAMMQPVCKNPLCVREWASIKRSLKPVPKKPKKPTRGLKGKAVTAQEKEYHDKLCALGCIACLKDGFYNNWVSIHHIDGRTKPGAHMNVLSLCAGHHQHNTGIPGLIAVHPNKALFEQKYGRQTDLLAECNLLLANKGEAA